MARRSGWWALAAVAVIFFLATGVGLVLTLFVSVRDGRPVTVIVAAALGGATMTFWAWIALGARARTRPQIDPDTGEAIVAEPVGPWGWVGRVLTAVVLGSFVVVIVWAGVAGRGSDAEARRVRTRAAAAASRADLTLTKVRDGRVAFQAWLASQDQPGDPGPNPLDELLPVSGARVVDAAVDPGHAALLIRPDGGPPCVVVDIDAVDRVTTRLSARC